MKTNPSIVEYLVDRYGDGRLKPRPDTGYRLRCTYWLHYAEGSAMPPLLRLSDFQRAHAAVLPRNSPLSHSPAM